jgi:hypothetical protein
VNAAEAIGALPKFFETIRTAPPAPLFMRALGRFAADLIINEAIKAGPTPMWLQASKAIWKDERDAREFYEVTMRDALGRTMIVEPSTFAEEKVPLNA